MLFLNFTDPRSIWYLLAAIFTAVTGNLAVFTGLPKGLKKAILSNDVDGFHVTIGGAILLVLGLAVPDYSWAYMLTALGLGFLSVGGLIWLRDDWTWKVMHPGVGFAYIAFAIIADVIANSNHPMGYDVRGLLTTVLPVAIAGFFVTLAFIALGSQTFKDRLLPVRGEGKYFVIYGGIAILGAPLAVLNPALMTVWGALAGIWLALGVLILVERHHFTVLYSKWNVALYVLQAITVLIICRFVF